MFNTFSKFQTVFFVEDGFSEKVLFSSFSTLRCFTTLEQELNEDLVFLSCSLSVALIGCFLELLV